MRTGLLFAIVLFGTSTTGAVSDEANHEPIPLNVGWRVHIDATGHVTDIKADTNPIVDRIPQLRTQLENDIRNWRFVPGSINGKPAATDSHLQIAFSLIPAGGEKFHIRIDHAGTGGWVEKYVAVRYPSEAIKNHKTGGVMLRIDYDEFGHATGASLADGSPVVDKVLVRASIESAKKWIFAPETVDGHAMAGSVLSPLCYEINGAKANCAFKTPGSPLALSEGQSVALNPVAKIESAVEGKML